MIAALNLIFNKLSKEGVAPLSPKSKSVAAAGSFGGSAGAAAAAAAAAGEADQGEGEGEQQAAAAPPERPAPPALRLLVKLLVPQALCGIIIGRSGTTIRQFASDTQTNIK